MVAINVDEVNKACAWLETLLSEIYQKQEDFNEALKSSAEKLGIDKAALRKVVVANLKDKILDLEDETSTLLAVIEAVK